MDIGIVMNPSAQSVEIAPLAKRAEELGFESLWAPEHTVIPADSVRRGVAPRAFAYIPDPFVALAAASSVTTTLRLGTAVCLVPERNPLLLAKEVATLDRLSGGRFVFGIGAGWLREESQIMGADFERRWTQTRESVLAMKELWTQDEAEFHGEYFDFPAVYSFPKPVQRPHPPVLLGSAAPNVFKRVVAWADGWMPIRVGPERVREGRAALTSLAESAGRDPESIQITVDEVPADRSLVGRLAEAGADRTIVKLDAAGGEGPLDQIQELSQALLR